MFHVKHFCHSLFMGKKKFSAGVILGAEPLKAHAASALAEMGDVKARAHLDHQRTKETDPAVKAAIEEALKHLHGREE